jgi:hypothetical protein
MSGKCSGRRKPPCGRGENCKGFEQGHRCGAHEPVKGCSGKGGCKHPAPEPLGLDGLTPSERAYFGGVTWRTGRFS